MAKQMKSAQVMLQREFMTIRKNPKSEFFTVYGLANDNIQEWIVYIIGPPDTLYEKGVYKAIMRFPDEFPMKPPSLQFSCDIFHPNIYKDGKVCISTLQTGPDGADKGQYWRPILGVEHALLSVVSLLSDPNVDDPANTTAANLYKSDIDSYRKKCRVFAEKSLKDIPDDFQYPIVKKEEPKKEKEITRRGLRLELDEDGPNVSSDYIDDEDSDWEPEYDPEDMSDGGYSEDSDGEKEGDSCSPSDLKKNRGGDDDEDYDEESAFPGSKKNRNSTIYGSKKKSGNGKTSTSKDAENSQSQNNTNTSNNSSSESQQQENLAPTFAFREKYQITYHTARFGSGSSSLSQWENICDTNSSSSLDSHGTKVKRSSLLRRSLGRVTKLLSV
mmetsp:Transcript_587/g.778  ORF Transcript_587/g.778 Transcript_587/m.778 type:complete len:386 (-) Transcript_587:257-1414(-)